MKNPHTPEPDRGSITSQTVGDVATAKGEKDVILNKQEGTQLTGLQAGTSYTVYVVAEGDTTYSTIMKTGFTTKGSGANSVPTITGVVSNIEATKATITINTNMAATIYWATGGFNQAAPMNTQMIQQNYGVQSARGMTSTAVSNAAISRTLNGLAPGNTYKAYLLAGVGSSYSTIFQKEFSTPNANTLPPATFGATTVKDSNTDATVPVKVSTANSEMFYTAQQKSDAAPTAEVVRNRGRDNAGDMNGKQLIAMANVERNIELSGLMSSTEYIVYVVYLSGGTLSPVSQKGFATGMTTAAAAPVWEIKNIKPDGVNVIASFKSDKAGEVYYAANSPAVGAPTRSQLDVHPMTYGVDGARGQSALQANQEKEVTMTGGSAGEEYTLYAAFKYATPAGTYSWTNIKNMKFTKPNVDTEGPVVTLESLNAAGTTKLKLTFEISALGAKKMD